MSLERVVSISHMAILDSELELTPAQPEAVARAVASLLPPHESPVDPWWQAGLDEALDT